MRNAIPLGLTLVFALLPAPPAAAQGADQQVAGLLQQGQQAYEQYLDIGSAQNYVDQAIRLVQQYGVTGNNAALAYALRGVIHVWMGEESQAVEMFKQALTNNPNVQVPAAWGGPDIDAAIEKARRQLPPPVTYPPPVTCPGGAYPLPNGQCPPVYTPPTCPGGAYPLPNGQCPPVYTPPVTCPGGVAPLPNGQCPPVYAPPVTCPGGVAPLPNGQCPPVAPAVPLTRHTPVTEQLWNHPVPIYLEVNPSITIGGVYLFYKSPSDIGYQRVEMSRSGPGYYVEIACTMLQPTAWDYYITVLDPQGNTLASEGAPDRPFHINMVQVLSPGALYPTRPDGSVVSDCGPDGTGAGQECPPGFPNCRGLACARTCTFNDDCLASEICMAGCCKTPGEGGGGGGNGEAIGLFFTVGAGLGVGLASGQAKEPKWATNVDGSSIYGPDDSYSAYDPVSFPHTGRQVVDIATGFALSGGAVRIGFGYFIIPELSLSANFRLAFPFDADFPWLVEGRLHYWFLSGPDHLFGAYAGGGAGLMTHMIQKVQFLQDNTLCGGTCDPAAKTYEPFYKVSGLGAISFGADYIYKFNDLFGLGGELGMNVMVPEFSFNIDLTLQLLLSF